jgi:hypothetical protein
VNRPNVLTRRSLEGGLLNIRMEEMNWIKYLRRIMGVVDNERELYFVLVFSFSNLSPAFCVLGFAYVLSSVVFLAEAFLRSIPKLRPCAWPEFARCCCYATLIKPLCLMVLWYYDKSYITEHKETRNTRILNTRI